MNKISQHFTYNEMIKSHTAIRLGIDNTPDDREINNAIYLANEILEKVRDEFKIPFAPNSWYRGSKLEYHISQHGYRNWCQKMQKEADKESWVEYLGLKSHPKGQAADIEIPGVSNKFLFDFCKEMIPVFDQLILEFHNEEDPSSGWVHISFNEMQNRRDILRY